MAIWHEMKSRIHDYFLHLLCINFANLTKCRQPLHTLCSCWAAAAAVMQRSDNKATESFQRFSKHNKVFLPLRFKSQYVNKLPEDWQNRKQMAGSTAAYGNFVNTLSIEQPSNVFLFSSLISTFDILITFAMQRRWLSLQLERLLSLDKSSLAVIENPFATD